MKKIFALILFIAPFIAQAQVIGLELPYGIKVLDTLATDAWYGPYPNIDSALSHVPTAVRKNRTVKIDTVEYWWRDGSADEDLIVKTSSSGGADITVVMDSIANAIDTLITNSAGENEIMVSDGTNAIPSGMKVTYDSSSLTRTIGNMGASYQLRLSPGGPVLIGPPEGSGGTEYKFFTNSFTAEGLFNITGSSFQWGFGTGTPTLDLTTNQVTIGNPLLQSSIIMYPNGHSTWPGLFLISAGLTLDIGASNLIFSKQKTTGGKHLLTIDNVGKVETKAMDTLVSVTQLMDSITNAIDTLSSGGSTNATAIRGVPLDESVGSPSDGDILVYRNDDSAWVLESKPTGGGIEIAQVMDSITNAIDTLVSITQMMDSIQNAIDTLSSGGGGSPDWGDIGGDMGDQEDLIDSLAAKANLAGATFTGKVNFTADATNAGLNIGSYSSIPSGVVLGDLFVDGTNSRIMVGSQGDVASVIPNITVSSLVSTRVPYIANATGRLNTNSSFTYNSGTLSTPSISVSTGATLPAATTIGTDPAEDALLYWDDTANQTKYLGIGSGLSISGGDLVATITPTASTGTAVAFDTNRSYCTSASACTGNITFNSSGAVVGQMATMIHNDSGAPTFGSEFIILSGEYVTSEDNYIMFFLRESGKVWVTISQEQ